MKKYSLVAERKIRMAQLDTEIGVIQDRPEKNNEIDESQGGTGCPTVF
jgi:hypothetical protein